MWVWHRKDRYNMECQSLTHIISIHSIRQCDGIIQGCGQIASIGLWHPSSKHCHNWLHHVSQNCQLTDLFFLLVLKWQHICSHTAQIIMLGCVFLITAHTQNHKTTRFKCVGSYKKLKKQSDVIICCSFFLGAEVPDVHYMLLLMLCHFYSLSTQ